MRFLWVSLLLAVAGFGQIVDNNSGSGGGSGGSVTSVSFTGGLISVANPTTTPALTVAGTSGGIPYFSSASVWASSGALTQHALIIGGGAGATPTALSVGATDKPLVGASGADPAFSKLTLTNPATGSTFTLADGKTFVVNSGLTLTGTDATTMTFPTTSQTIPGLSQANTFTGQNTFQRTLATGTINTLFGPAIASYNAGIQGEFTNAGNSMGVINDETDHPIVLRVIKQSSTAASSSAAISGRGYGTGGNLNYLAGVEGETSFVGAGSPTLLSGISGHVIVSAGSPAEVDAFTAFGPTVTNVTIPLAIGVAIAIPDVSAGGAVTSFYPLFARGRTSADFSAFLDHSITTTVTARTGAGQTDSPYFLWSGSGFDTTEHGVEWQAFADVTSNAGASTWTLQSRIKPAATATRFSITDGGLITAGTWNASLITGTYGGTGVNNGSFTITLAGNLVTTGAFNTTFAQGATTTQTLPTTSQTIPGMNQANTAGSSMTWDLSATSATAGLKIPSVAGAIPTADGFVATNTTNHTEVRGGNGTTYVNAAAATGTGTATDCSPQLIKAISGVAVPACAGAQEPPGAPAATYTSARYYAPVGGFNTTSLLVNGTELAMPFLATSTGTFDRIGTQVTTLGGTGAVLRFGIYADANGCPGNLVLDGSTAVSTSTGWKEVTVSQSLTAGTWYWLSVVGQGAPTPQATILALAGDMLRVSGTSAEVGAGNVAAYSRTAITGALTNWGGCGSAAATTAGPRIGIRKS